MSPREHRFLKFFAPFAPSTYHAHAARQRDSAQLSARARQGAVLKIEVRRVFEENFRVYGVRKVWQHLKREGSTSSAARWRGNQTMAA